VEFAGGVGQGMMECDRAEGGVCKASAEVGPEQGPGGAIVRGKRPEGDKKEDGIKANKRGEAASSS